MELIRHLDGAHAYLLLCTLIFVEEAGIPLPFLPGDVILLAAGYLAAVHSTHLLLFLALGYSSAVLGALLCYLVSRQLGRRAVLRWGRHVHLTPHRLDRAERWLARRGWLAIFLARVLPGTRINASIAAGCLRLPLGSFARGVLPSTVIWLGGFTLLGFLLGDSVTPYLPWFDRAVGAAITVALLVAVVVWWRRRRAAGRADAGAADAEARVAA
ncbi:MAG TPA: DedA family protein [Candidatus Dormibacteraeota bacterium]|nr:DedA family protein [Candidatus Dormibacteraeota bacterium]